MDVHISSRITEQLRLRGVDVLTAQEDLARELSDPDLLDRAGKSGRIVFTNDVDFLIEAGIRQRTGRKFIGVIYASQRRTTIGQCVDDLELIGKTSDPTEWFNRVEYLPHK